MSRSWQYVVLSCLLEITWVFGFNVAVEIWHWGVILILIGIDFYLLTKACDELPTGTVYAIFSAVGTVGAVILDTWYFEVPFSMGKIFFIGLLIVGVISLRLADAQEEKGEN